MSASTGRRGFLSGMAAVAVAGFDPVRRSWVSTAEAAGGPLAKLPPLDGEVTTQPAALAEAASDFGHTVSRKPIAVLRPGSIADIEKMVKYAIKHCLDVSMRGQGHSTDGQAQVKGGIVIDSSSLATIHQMGDGVAVVDPGVVWRDLIEATAAIGLTPPTITDYIDLSVGGTLSGAGVGGSSFLHGAQVDNVLELEVVTGTGQRCTCSPTKNPLLFNAVLGGLGQFAIIVRAKLRLVPAPTLVRMFQAAYPSIGALLADLNTLVLDERFSHVETLFAPTPDGGWAPVLFASSFYHPGDEPDDAALLAGLSFVPPTLTAVDMPYVAFTARFDQLFEAQRQNGDWQKPHPWFDMFIPASKAEAYLTEALANLPFDQVGASGNVLLYPFRRSRMNRPFLRVPGEEVFFLFDIARTIVTGPAGVTAAVQSNRALYEKARDIGGKRYCIGTIPFSTKDWRDHFGPAWAAFVAAKLAFDPLNLLATGQGIFDY